MALGFSFKVRDSDGMLRSLASIMEFGLGSFLARRRDMMENFEVWVVIAANSPTPIFKL